MSRTFLTVVLAATVAVAAMWFATAHAADRPDNPPPPRDAGGPPDGSPDRVPPDGGPPDGGPRRPGGYHLLPPHAREHLRVTPEQQRQLDDLEAEVKTKLDKILTAEQSDQLEQMRPPPPPPPRDGPGGQGPDDGPDRSRQPPPDEDGPKQSFRQQGATKGNDPSRVEVIFSHGHETDPRDHGRPVVLIAAALDVAPEVFRTAFSNVKPASGGRDPEPAQVRLNKETPAQEPWPLRHHQ